ncbi:MAG TPA: carbon-nitrogen hydrolase family protein [Gemmatimonadaceae bacterium]|jgi:predicted amidohydrolase
MVRIAIVQDEPVPILADGLARTRDRTLAAAREGAQLVVFPETWLPGYPVWLDVCRDVALWDHPPVKAVHARMAANAVAVPGDGADALGAIARDAGVTLVVGVIERVDAGPGHGTLYNAALTFGPDGRLLNHHRKLMPTYSERLVWGQGDADGLQAVDTPNGRVGALVCWEHWMPLARQAMHESGEDVHVALWPTAHEQLQLASRAYAFEGRCYVLVAGSLSRASALPPELEPHPEIVRRPDQWVMRGGSGVIGPDGRYIVEPVYDEPRTITADLDLARLSGERMALDVAGHYSRPDLLHLDVVRGRRR